MRSPFLPDCVPAMALLAVAILEIVAVSASPVSRVRGVLEPDPSMGRTCHRPCSRRGRRGSSTVSACNPSDTHERGNAGRPPRPDWGPTVPLDIKSWRAVYNLALDHGWRPTGTEPPADWPEAEPGPGKAATSRPVARLSMTQMPEAWPMRWFGAWRRWLTTGTRRR